MTFDAGSIEGVATLDKSPFLDALDELKASAREFTANDLSVRATVDSDDAYARLDSLNHEADKLDGRDVSLNVNVKGGDEATAQLALLGKETDDANSSLSKLNKTAADSGGSFNPLMDAIILLGPALIPIAGAAIPLLGGLVGVLGSVALGVKGVADEMKAGTPDGQQFTDGINTLKGDLTTLETVAAHNLLAPFNAGLADAARLMPQVTDETSRFSTVGGQIVGNVLDALVSAFVQLDPLLTMGANELLRGSVALDGWASSSGGIKDFTSWAVSNFPQIEHEVGDIVTAVVKLAEAFSETGGTALTEVSLIARVIDSLPLDVLTHMVTVLVDGYAAWKAYQGIEFVVGIYDRITASIAASNAAIDVQEAAQASLPALMEANTVAQGEYIAAVELAAAGNLEAAGTMVALGVAADEAQVAMDAATIAAEGDGLAMESALGPIGAVLAVVGLLATQFIHAGSSTQAATQAQQSYTDAVKEDTGAIGDHVKAQLAQNLAQSGALSAANALGISTKQITSAVTDGGPAYAALIAELKSMEGGMGATSASAKALISILDDQKDGIATSATEYKELQGALAAMSTTTDATTSAVQQANSDWQTAVSTAKDATTQIQVQTRAMQAENDAAGLLTNAFKILNGGTLDVAEAQTGLEDATNQMTQTLLKNHDVVKDGTAASVDDEKAIQQQVQALQDRANAEATSTKSTVLATQNYQANAAATLQSVAAQEGLISNNPHLTQAQNLAATAAKEAGDQTYQYYSQLLNVANFKPAPTILDVETGRAQADLGQLLAELNSFSIPRTTTVRVASTTSTGTANANGNYYAPVQAYADGAHVAQVAPAGANRLWAEPETGGEAYIPLSPTKRVRSEQILGQVADNFGMKVTKYANGGLNGDQGAGMVSDLMSTRYLEQMIAKLDALPHAIAKKNAQMTADKLAPVMAKHAARVDEDARVRDAKGGT